MFNRLTQRRSKQIKKPFIIYIPKQISIASNPLSPSIQQKTFHTLLHVE